MTCDILIIGAGLAGIRAAITCAGEGKSVVLVTSASLCSGSSFYPLMDTLHCLCTDGPEDKALFMQDIRDCSQGVNDPYMSEYYVNHIEDCLEHMPDMGIHCELLPERKLACFGHTPRKLYYWKDWDGIRRQLRQVIAKTGNITLLEHTELIQLLTHSDFAAGGLFMDSEKIFPVFSKAVILASGGISGLYLHSLSTPDVCGSAHMLALKAGARLVNMEFNQFIPGFISPAYKTVFREGTLRYCEGVTGPDGRDVLRELLPNPHDYKKCLLLREPHGPFTFSEESRYFDIALFKTALEGRCQIKYSPDIWKDERGYVQDYLAWLKDTLHVELDRDVISIAPFFHAANGGIQVDHRCCSSVAGLYACGEAAGGIHGADRLGGMASGSCLVFGELAAKSACEYAAGQSLVHLKAAEIEEQLKRTYSCCSETIKKEADLPGESPSEAAWAAPAAPSPVTPAPATPAPAAPSPATPAPAAPADISKRIQELMWTYGNIIRTREGISTAMGRIDGLARELDSHYSLESCQNHTQLRAFLKAHQYADLSRAVLLAMLFREESRGSHYRQDFPFTDDTRYRRQHTVSLRDNGLYMG